nr:MAG TPA: hypothetical protein [Caudoviricetes sp.]
MFLHRSKNFLLKEYRFSIENDTFLCFETLKIFSML